MKNTILIIALVFFANSIFSQIPYNTSICDNGVSTNWNSPSNNNLPVYGGGSNQWFLNQLNWVDGNLLNKNFSLNNMHISSVIPDLEISNIKPQTLPSAWYEYLFNEQEMNPSESWELLASNLGRYPNDIDVHGNSQRENLLILFCTTNLTLQFEFLWRIAKQKNQKGV